MPPPVSLPGSSAGPILSFVAAIALIVFIIYTLILAYHWIRYGWSYPLVWGAALLYGVGSSLILAVLFAAAGAV